MKRVHAVFCSLYAVFLVACGNPCRDSCEYACNKFADCRTGNVQWTSTMIENCTDVCVSETKSLSYDECIEGKKDFKDMSCADLQALVGSSGKPNSDKFLKTVIQQLNQ